jgi:hypothetical protein
VPARISYASLRSAAGKTLSRFIIALTALLAQAAAHAASPIRDYSGLLESSASRFRAGAGLTNPIAYGFPDWLRGNNADMDFLSRNPAFSASLHEKRRRWYPVSVQARQSGSLMNAGAAFINPNNDLVELYDDVADTDGELQRAYFSLSSVYILRNFAWSASYLQQRNLWEDDGVLYYQLFRDLGVQFTGAGIFADGPWGRLDAGMTVKMVLRSGGDYNYTQEEAVETLRLSDADFPYSGTAFGLDFGFLYSSSGTWREDSFGWQLGLVAKDIGSSKFLTLAPIVKLLGADPPEVLNLPSLPFNPGVGLGLKLPNFSDGLRSALRLEYVEWTRSIPASEKWSVSYELRLPVWASVHVGYRADEVSGGLGFRFPGLELDIGSYSELWGDDADRRQSRGILVELRSVL